MIRTVVRFCTTGNKWHYLGNEQWCTQGFINLTQNYYIFTRLGTCFTCCPVPLRYNARQFWGYKSLYIPLGTPLETRHSYTERLVGNRTWLIERHQNQWPWPWVTLKVNSPIASLFKRSLSILMQRLTRFQLPQGVARSLCDSWATSCFIPSTLGYVFMRSCK